MRSVVSQNTAATAIDASVPTVPTPPGVRGNAHNATAPNYRPGGELKLEPLHSACYIRTLWARENTAPRFLFQNFTKLQAKMFFLF